MLVPAPSSLACRVQDTFGTQLSTVLDRDLLNERAPRLVPTDMQYEVHRIAI